MEALKFAIEQGPQFLGYAIMCLSGALGIALLVPGDHPDKELQAAVDFLNRFSRK